VQKFSKKLDILCIRRVTWSKSNSEDPQIFGANIQNLVATATWRPGSVHSWPTPCSSGTGNGTDATTLFWAGV